MDMLMVNTGSDRVLDSLNRILKELHFSIFSIHLCVQAFFCLYLIRYKLKKALNEFEGRIRSYRNGDFCDLDSFVKSLSKDETESCFKIALYVRDAYQDLESLAPSMSGDAFEQKFWLEAIKKRYEEIMDMTEPSGETAESLTAILEYRKKYGHEDALRENRIALFLTNLRNC